MNYVHIQLLFAPASDDAIPGSTALEGHIHLATELGDPSVIDIASGDWLDRRRCFLDDTIAEAMVAIIRDLTGTGETTS